MNFCQKTLQELLVNEKFGNITSVLSGLQDIFQITKTMDTISPDLITPDIFEEALIVMSSNENISLYFGKTLKDLKCEIKDIEKSRKHEIYFQYKGPRRFNVSSVNIPYSSWQDQEYSKIEDVISGFRQHLEVLSNYFHQLECIDRCCTVMEPVNPSFKEDYRRIILDNRTWLNIEVTLDGLATNVYLIGQSDYWQDKLQEGLLKWDHDIDIVKNIMHTFDITEFPVSSKSGLFSSSITEEIAVKKPACSICLCDDLPDIPGVPLPLCQNPTCGIYFHRTCLFQWLVACAGGRSPAFGVATGSCPTCLQPISCNEKDS